MKRRSLYNILLISTLFLAGCAPSTVNQFNAEGKNQLSKEQLEDGVAGKKIRLEAIDFDANVEFLPNGTLAGTQRDGTRDRGKWSVSEDNLLCIKFSKWYFGDLRCYQVFNDLNSQFVLFTSNGARYYTATVTNTSIAAGDAPMKKSTPSMQSPPARTISTPEENRDRIIRLARNCPDCNLQNVDLSRANLIGAKLSGADLSGADLSGSNLRRADLSGANLTRAKLVQANMPGADLTDCNLKGADLSGANLTRAIVHGTDFTGAITKGAILNSLQGTIE
jgi:hypothetical protein